MLVEQIRGNLADDAWRPANTDVLRLDQWEAQKNRLRKRTDGGVDVALSLDRGTRLRDGDVLWADAAGESIIVARLEIGEVMLIELPRRDAEGALRAAVELGHAIGNQHWPAVVKGEQVFVPVTLDRKVMDSVMRAHAFIGISHRFVPGADVIPYLAPHEARSLFGGAEQSAEHPLEHTAGHEHG